MALEQNVTYISDLVPTNPLPGDLRSQGADHIRNIKLALKDTFPNITGPVSATQAQLNQFSTPSITKLTLTQSDTASGAWGGSATLSLVDGRLVLSALDASGNNVRAMTWDVESTGLMNLPAILEVTGKSSSGVGIISTGEVLANGTVLCPVGSIIMWSGSSSTIPDGWHICDGSNGTVDMRSRIARGIGADAGLAVGGSDSQTVTISAATSTAGSHTHTVSTQTAGSHAHYGTTDAHTLTVDEIPSHTHGQHGVGFGVGSGSGTFYAAGDVNGNASTNLAAQTQAAGNGGGHSHTFTTSNAGDHTHGVTVTTDGDHSHTLTGSATVQTLPAFQGVYFIQRIA